MISSMSTPPLSTMSGTSVVEQQGEVCELAGPSCLRELRAIKPLACVSERYYKHKLYRSGLTNDHSNQDLLVLAHSNRILIVTLAPTHDILALNKTVRRVHFGTDKVNRLDNKVKGKWKKGAQKVQVSSILCTVECEDDTSYDIAACVTGKIVEINKRLIEKPSLLASKPWSDGFIAITLPPFHSQEASNLQDYSQ